MNVETDRGLFIIEASIFLFLFDNFEVFIFCECEILPLIIYL